MNNKSSFDRLVLDLSNAERIELLNKMKQSSNSSTASFESLMDIKDEEKDLSVKIKNESFILRIWLKIKSLFTSCTVDYLYNKYLLSIIASEVQAKTPNLIDNRNGLLLQYFYDELGLLKNVSDFFKSGIGTYEENKGAFLVFLGSLVFPNLEQDLEKKANPYNLSFSDPITQDTKAILSRSMDEILQTLPGDQKLKMYACVQAIEWLKLYTKLPFERMMNRFSPTPKGQFACTYDSIVADLEILTKVLANCKAVPVEVLEGLFLFTYKMQTTKKIQEASVITVGDDAEEIVIENENSELQDSMISQECASYVEKAQNQLNIILGFLTTVPLIKVTRLAAISSVWEPERIEGVEDWFVKFKSQWKKNLEKNWEAWLQERNKYEICEKLKIMFKIKDFPLIENRPWATAWDGIPFNKEYPLGYLYFFFKQFYPETIKTLKIVVTEGEFIYRENLNEITEAYNVLNRIDQELTNLNAMLAPKGSYGDTFIALSTGTGRTIQNYAKIKGMLQNIEIDVDNMIIQFTNASNSAYRVLNGILSPNKAKHYESLGNLSSIQGNLNEYFKRNVQRATNIFGEAAQMIKEVNNLTPQKLAKN